MTEIVRTREQGHHKAASEWWLVCLTGVLATATVVLAGITGILAHYTYKLWDSTSKLAKDAKDTATMQAADMKASLAIAKNSADASLLTAQNMQTADRAYVKMSHCKPGLTFSNGKPARSCHITVEIQNCGRTPALVTHVYLRLWPLEWVDEVPNVPDYSEPTEHTSHAFMVPTDHYFYSRSPTLGLITETHPKDTKRLLIIGYIDYIDAFGIRHRAGYGRRYEDRRHNNLVFVDKPGYNYDRKRKPGEGKDWDNPL